MGGDIRGHGNLPKPKNAAAKRWRTIPITQNRCICSARALTQFVTAVQSRQR